MVTLWDLTAVYAILGWKEHAVRPVTGLDCERMAQHGGGLGAKALQLALLRIPHLKERCVGPVVRSMPQA